MLSRNAALTSSNFARTPCTCFAGCHQPRAFRGPSSYRFTRQVNRQWSKERAFSSSSTSTSASSSESPVKISHLLGALLVFGIGATSWGLYEFYATLTLWPKEVRTDLRAGLRAKHRGDMKLARRHLTKAWSTVQSMSPETLSQDPYLKLSGVAIVLAEVLEAEHELDEAFSVLKTTLTSFINSKSEASTSGGETDSATSTTSWSASSHPRLSLMTLLDSRSTSIKSQLNTKTRMRAVALALKLSDLAEALERPEDEERWLGFAVTEVLRLVRDEYGLAHDSRHGFRPVSGSGLTTMLNGTENPGANVSRNVVDGKGNTQRQNQSPNTSVRDILSPDATNDELGLPNWVSLTKSELAAPMERLGAFYARQGKYGNAIILYRVASSLLVQPKLRSSTSSKRSSPPSVTELCQALQIENAHMALMMDLRRARPHDATVQRDLPRVLTRAVHIYDEAVRRHGGRREAARERDDGIPGDSEMSLCDETYPAVLYNAGIYYEEDGQLEQALRSYTLSYRAMRTHGSRDMMYEAAESARRVQRMLNRSAKQAPETSQQGQ